MSEPPLPTVVCHFRNEEVYLRYWLRHHVRLFGHGVLIDYHSTDRSREIARELAPAWEVRTSRNALFDSAAVDAEVTDVELGLAGWKMCLNATEFLVHHDLGAYLAGLGAARPGAAGVVTTGYIVQDAPDQVGAPLDPDRPLWEQRHFGLPEPDPVSGGVALRRRLLHREPHGRYTPGRHGNGVTDRSDPPLYLLWYGWCPLALKRARNRSTGPMVPAGDRAKGWGAHHVMTDAQVDAAWRDQYLPRCHDLLGGRHPGLAAAVAALTAARADRSAAAGPDTEGGGPCR